MKLNFKCNSCRREFVVNKDEYLNYIYKDEKHFIRCPYDSCKELVLVNKYSDVDKIMKTKAKGKICR